MTYTDAIQTTDKALCHLFLHCCYKDGTFTEAELDNVSAKFAALGLNKDLNFKDELIAYKNYRSSISSERMYIQDLVAQINPTSDLALFSYCLELGLSDSSLDFTEKDLMDVIGDVLDIDKATQEAIQKLLVQRQLVAVNKFF